MTAMAGTCIRGLSHELQRSCGDWSAGERSADRRSAESGLLSQVRCWKTTSRQFLTQPADDHPRSSVSQCPRTQGHPGDRRGLDAVGEAPAVGPRSKPWGGLVQG